MKLSASIYCTAFIIILSFISRSNLHASNTNCFGEATLEVGWFSATHAKSQHIDIKGLVGDDFHAHKSADQNFFVGAGYYFNGLDFREASLLYGINAFYFAPTKIKGDVIQEGIFTNLSYHYSRTNYPIYFAAKALIHCYSCYDLVIDLGVGPNIMNTKGFKERSLDGGITSVDAHLFSGKSCVTFSATAGLGLRFKNALGNHSFEVGYRFFYLGEGKLKKINNQLKNTLHTGNSYANAIVFSVAI